MVSNRRKNDSEEEEMQEEIIPVATVRLMCVLCFYFCFFLCV